MKKNFLFLIICSMIIFFACNNQPEQKITADTLRIENQKTKIEKKKTSDTLKKSKKTNPVVEKEYTARYICPDHCKGSGSDTPGVCKSCGMELIENPGYKK